MDLTILEQHKFVKHFVEKKSINSAVIIGIAGFYSIPFMRFIGRIMMNKMFENELLVMLLVNPLKSAVFFTISIIAIYFVSILAGGRKAFKDYVVSSGFIGLYFLFISILMTSVSFFSRFISNANDVEQSYVAAIIILIIICIFLLIFTVRYGIVALSEVSGFGSFKSFLIWTVSFVPTLGFFIAWVR